MELRNLPIPFTYKLLCTSGIARQVAGTKTPFLQRGTLRDMAQRERREPELANCVCLGAAQNLSVQGPGQGLEIRLVVHSMSIHTNMQLMPGTYYLTHIEQPAFDLYWHGRLSSAAVFLVACARHHPRR